MLESSPISIGVRADLGGEIGRDHADGIAQELADDIEHAERRHDGDGDRRQRIDRALGRGTAFGRHPGFPAPAWRQWRNSSRAVIIQADSGCPAFAGHDNRKEHMTAVDFAAFVDRLATVSGEAILPFFRTSLGVENKGGAGTFDPVTAADRAAETAMRTLIRESFPDHGIVGEEFGNERTDAEYVLGARSDRRHQVLHRRHAGLGHADRADARRASRSTA